MHPTLQGQTSFHEGRPSFATMMMLVGEASVLWNVARVGRIPTARITYTLEPVTPEAAQKAGYMENSGGRLDARDLLCYKELHALLLT